ncbi:lipase family protein [Nocardia sp. NPDC051030]|uniref:lipase family protein n=1 Tax=Nocardia sp. NPDC051030 TaxID=3155162 RepID=UPI00344665D7
MRRNGSFARAAGTVALCVFVVSAEPRVATADTGNPGQLIESQPLPASIRGIEGGSVLSYWTNGATGTPVQATGALFVPPGEPPSGGWPVVVYDHGTTGMAADCSGGVDSMFDPDPVHAERVSQFFRDWVSKGYAVVAPDYVGLGRFDTGPHPYLDIGNEATATLDMLRAAHQREPGLSRTWAVVGESQGGQAALGTSHLQAAYVPDLDFRGTVAVDPESDVELVLTQAGPSTPAIGDPTTTGYNAMILAALRAARPALDVDSYLTPMGRTVADTLDTMCLPAIQTYTLGMGLGSLLSRPLSDTRFRDTLTDYMAVPTSGYTAPILLLLNVTDTQIPSPLHGLLAAQFATNGVNFRAVPGFGEHVSLNPAQLTAMSDFLAQALTNPAR